MTESAIRTPDDDLDSETVEEWTRLTDEPDVRGVVVSSDGEWWQVVFAVAEYIREEPLESTLVDAVTAALTAVPGAGEVHHEDREVWLVSGSPSGEQLVAAAAGVVDALADELRAAV